MKVVPRFFALRDMSLSFDFLEVLMKTFLVKQKFRLGGERFAIKDDRGEIAYQVEGSFFKIPKTFTYSMMLMVNRSVRSVKKS